MTTSVNIIASHQPFLAKRGFDYMETLAKQLDYFSPDSELSHLNAIKGSVAVSPLLYRALLLSRIMQTKTGNMFRVDFEGISRDPQGEHRFRVGPFPWVHLGKDTLINLGGIAKGYIVDRTFAFLRQQGAQNILVDAGGDIRVQSMERPWKIGLYNPLNAQSPYGVIKLMSGALVTSGLSERSRGIGELRRTPFFNPQTATFYKETPFVSVSVQGQFASVSEVYAKCLLMGHRPLLGKHHKAVGVRADYKVIVFDSKGYPSEQAARLKE